MKCAPFDCIRATSVEEVVTTLAGCDGDGKILAGGQAWCRYWPGGRPGRRHIARSAAVVSVIFMTYPSWFGRLTVPPSPPADDQGQRSADGQDHFAHSPATRSPLFLIF